MYNDEQRVNVRKPSKDFQESSEIFEGLRNLKTLKEIKEYITSLPAGQ